MYPFPGIGGATYLGNGTYTRQPQPQPQQPAPQQPQGLLAPQQPGMAGVPPPGANPSAPNSMVGAQVGPNSAMGTANPYAFSTGYGGGFGSNPFAQNSMMGANQNAFGMTANPYAFGTGYGGGFGSPFAQNGALSNPFGGGYGMNTAQFQGPSMAGGMGMTANPYAFGSGYGGAFGNPFGQNSGQ